jgi:DNA-binding transcriptional LysR family regulator
VSSSSIGLGWIATGAAFLAGVGLPSTYCEKALASGALVRLLPKWASPQIPLFAVYSNRKFRPLRLNIFLEALAAWKSPLWLRE